MWLIALIISTWAQDLNVLYQQLTKGTKRATTVLNREAQTLGELWPCRVVPRERAFASETLLSKLLTSLDVYQANGA